MGTLRQKKDPQHHSTKLRGVESGQVDWLGDTKNDRKPKGEVNRAYLLGLPTLRRAIRYALSLADLEPKEVYEQLGMDKATWSRIENGLQDFPAGKLGRLRLILGNDAVHMWLAHEAGQELKPLRSELEIQLEAERAENADLRQRLATITEFVRETQGRR